LIILKSYLKKKSKNQKKVELILGY